jgi:hypothetical protein
MSDTKSANQTTKPATKRVPFRIIKKLQNLYSWKEFYTKLAQPNPRAARKIDEEIESIKKEHGLLEK